MLAASFQVVIHGILRIAASAPGAYRSRLPSCTNQWLNTDMARFGKPQMNQDFMELSWVLLYGSKLFKIPDLPFRQERAWAVFTVLYYYINCLGNCHSQHRESTILGCSTYWLSLLSPSARELCTTWI